MIIHHMNDNPCLTHAGVHAIFSVSEKCELNESKGKNKGSKERTKSLLYCYFTDTAYLIDVMDHDSFGSQTVIEIMHENWPELLHGFRIPGVTPYVRLSDEQTFETRAGYSTFTTTRDGLSTCHPVVV